MTRLPHDGSTGVPGYLTGATGSLLVWWHEACGEPAAWPVVLCPTLFDEAIGAYRGWRDLACALARAGHPVLRFDLPGEGDAFDAGPAGGAIDACVDSWTDAVALAISAAQSRAGSARVILIGLSLGALLAARAAASRRDVAGLILLAAPPSGRAGLRALRLLNGVAAETMTDGTAVGGFVLDRAMTQAIEALDWPEGAAGPPTLRVGQTQRPWPQAAEDRLRTWAAPLALHDRDDLDRLTVMAQSAHWPSTLTTQMLDWMAKLPPRSATDAGPGAGEVWPVDAEWGGVHESVVEFRPGAGAF